MTTIVEALRARAEILEKATVFMDDDDELAEESLDEVQLWRAAADEIEASRDRVCRLAEEIWQIPGCEEVIL